MSPSDRTERGLAFLPVGADDTTLAKAAAANQREWIVRTARAGGGAVHRGRGATWVVSPRTACLAFPSLSAGRAASLLPEVVSAARGAGVIEASCWSSLPTRPPDLHARLLALGFEEGWQAHWMAIELDRLRPAGVPHGVVVAEAGEGWTPTTLPLRRRRIDDRPARARPGTAAPRLARRRLAGRAPGGARRRVRHGGKARRRRPLRRRGGAGQSVAAASGAP